MSEKRRKNEGAQKMVDPLAKDALRCSGSRATEKIPLSDETCECTPFARRIAARLMTMEHFIEHHASGTLRKNARLGLNARNQYLEERTAFEFGYEFECVAESRVTWGTPITEGDCKPMTEAGWFIDRYVEVNAFPGDEFEAKYIIVEYADGSRKEGLGLVVRRTSAPFVPDRSMIFAIITEFDRQKMVFLPAKNPC